MRTADPKRNQRELDELFDELMTDSPAPQIQKLNPWFVAACAASLVLWVAIVNFLLPVVTR